MKGAGYFMLVGACVLFVLVACAALIAHPPPVPTMEALR